jgi:hypothetical protein
LNPTWLQSIIDSYLSIDDVFSTSFLQTLFIQTPNGGSIELGSGVCEYLEKYGTETILAVSKPIKSSSHQMEAGSSSSGGNTIPSGPYFYSDGNLYKAYRLYVDELSAFMFGTYTPDRDIYCSGEEGDRSGEVDHEPRFCVYILAFMLHSPRDTTLLHTFVCSSVEL